MKTRFGRSIRLGTCAGMVAATLIIIGMTKPATAQGVQGLRVQTQTINRAIGNQIQQAMRPKLQIRNGAGPITQLELGQDGRTIAITSADGAVRVWDLETGRQTKRLSVGAASSVNALDVGTLPVAGATRSRSVAGAGLRAVITGGSDGTATLYDAVAGTMIRQFRDQGAILAARLAPGGALLATAGSGRSISLWETASGRKTAELKGHGDTITTLAYSGSGRLLASGGNDGSVRLWSLPAGGSVATLDAGSKVTSLAFGGDDRIVAGTKDGKVRVWSASGAQIGSWSAEDDPVTGLSVSRNGAVATAAGDNMAHVWTATGGSGARIKDANNKVTLVAFSPDGSRVITAGTNGLARVWDAADGRFLAQLIPTTGGWAVTDANGRFDGSEGGVGNVAWAADQGTFEISNFSEPYFEPGLLAKTLRAPGALITAAAPAVEAGVGVPPSVTLTAASGTSAGAPGPTTITVTASDQGAGVAKVSLFQNDKAVDPSRVTADSGPGRTRTVSYNVDLSAGTNNFRANAASVERIEGLPATLTVRVSSPEQKPTLHLVTVGINKYANPQMTLNYAVADAKGFVDWAKKQVNPDFAKIEVHQLFDGAATRAGILGQLQALKSTKPEDVVMIYLAGHGENANGSWYFLPTEFGRSMSLAGVSSEGVSSQMIEDGILKMGASRVFMMIDACKSGSLSKAFAADADRKDLQMVSRSAGIHVLAATDKDQLAVELTELGHGAFTYTVLQGLEGRSSGESIVRAKSVLSYASENVPVVAFKYTQMEQYPTVFSRGSDFEVGRKGR